MTRLLLALLALAGCTSAPPARRITHTLVDPAQTFARHLRAEQLALSVAVATGEVVHSADPEAPPGVWIALPEPLQRGQRRELAVAQPEARAPIACFSHPARAEDDLASWALAVEGEPVELGPAPRLTLTGPDWAGQLVLEVRDGPEGPWIAVTSPGSSDAPLALGRGGYLWLGPGSGWERRASGTLIAVRLRKRAG